METIHVVQPFVRNRSGLMPKLPMQFGSIAAAAYSGEMKIVVDIGNHCLYYPSMPAIPGAAKQGARNGTFDRQAGQSDRNR